MRSFISPAWLLGIELSAFVQGPDNTAPRCAECYAALSAAVEVTAAGVNKSHRGISPQAGSSVWTAMERVAIAANLVYPLNL